MILPVANTLVELKTDLPFINGYDLQNKRLTTIATNAVNQNSTFQFRVENFNGRTVNFYLVDNDTANANTADDWVLYLKLKGVVEK
jgi:flagellar basal body rod protein FlgC